MPTKFNSELHEPEEQQKVEEVIFNPLDESVNEKVYSQSNVNAADPDLNKPIEEPRFTPPPLNKKPTPQDEPKKREPINPEMKQMPKKETEMAASQMAKLVIQGYEWMHEFANKGLQVSEKKINKLQAEGEINLNALIDYDYGKKIRAGDFFQEYNKQISGILKVSDEFKEEVTPVLERVLAKRGVGLTDEQFLMYIFAKDIAGKSLIFYQQKAQMNYMIESIKQATTAQYVPQAQPQRPQPQPQASQQEQQQNSSSNGSGSDEYASVVNDGGKKENSVKPDAIIMPPSTRKRGRPETKKGK